MKFRRVQVLIPSAGPPSDLPRCVVTAHSLTRQPTRSRSLSRGALAGTACRWRLLMLLLCLGLCLDLLRPSAHPEVSALARAVQRPSGLHGTFVPTAAFAVLCGPNLRLAAASVGSISA